MNVRRLLGRVDRRLEKFVLQTRSKVTTPFLLARVARSRQSLIDPSNPMVVTLTSYGHRLDSVHLAIESIGRGSSRPRRLILWTDPGVDPSLLSLPLQKQRDRGLEIISSPAAYGPHTKYFPYAASVDHHEVPLVTADDDTLYPRWWLGKLQEAAAREPELVLCYRAHRVRILGDGSMAAYNTWAPVRDTRASVLNFATGVSGVYYPASLLARLREDGDGFLGCSPRADDVWLHSREIAHRYLIRQIGRSPLKFPEIGATQQSALHIENTGKSANDRQLAATYNADLLRLLAREDTT